MGRRVVTAAEMEKMTPTEQQAHFDASVVLDLNDVPQRFLDTVRERMRERISNTESTSHNS